MFNPKQKNNKNLTDEERALATVSKELQAGFKNYVKHLPPPSPQYHFKLYTDGCCVNNGTKQSYGGYGVVILDAHEQLVTTLSGSLLGTTNNRAELIAVIEGIKALPTNVNLELHSDSIYVVNTVMNGWRINTNRDLWLMLLDELQLRKIHFYWVKGHNGDKYNEYADKLASLATRKAKG